MARPLAEHATVNSRRYAYEPSKTRLSCVTHPAFAFIYDFHILAYSGPVTLSRQAPFPSMLIATPALMYTEVKAADANCAP